MASPLDSLLPIVTPEGQPIKGSRVKDAASAASIYNSIRQRNQQYALNQTKVQMGIDGAPPYDPAALVKNQQKGTANINTGRLKAIVEEACLPLMDQVNGVQKFLNIAYDQKGDEDLSEQASIVEEEHYALLTRSNWFNYQKSALILQLAAHGVAVTFFSDPYCWEWKSAHLGEFMIPFQTEANEDAVEVGCMVRSLNPSQLIGYLDSPDEGWNKDAIRKVLINASPEQPRWDDFAQWEAMWKANDYYYNSVMPKIRVVHMWIRESDEEVSYFLFQEQENVQDFLYKGVRKYEQQREAFQLFSFDVGTDGYYHSIRGVGYKAFALVNEINRIVSSFLDGMRLSSKVLLKPTSEEALQNLLMIEHGGLLVIPPEMDVQQSAFPNLAQTLVPGMNILNALISQNLPGSYSQPSPLAGDARKTKAEIMNLASELAYVSQGKGEIFMKKWEDLLIEQFRRICRKDYKEQERGGKAVAEFKKRCKDRGVEDSFWDKIDYTRTTAERAMGAGSAQQQFIAMERILQFMAQGFYDQEGMQRIIKEATRMVVGRDKANSFCGDQKIGRPVQDEKNAQFENQIMSEGKPQPVWPNDNNAAHAKIHLGVDGEQGMGSIFEDATALQEADQYGDDEAILRIVPSMTIKLQHTVQHVELMQDGPQAAQYRQVLQQIGGMLENAQKKASKIMQERYKAEQQMSEEQGLEQQQADQNFAHESWNLQRDLIASKMKIQSLQQENQIKLQFQRESHAQELAQKDRLAAQQLAFKQAEESLKPQPNGNRPA